jgi:hypothetical protein
MKSRTVGLLVAMMLWATLAGADQVTITSGGWLNAAFLDGGGMTLVSDRFTVSGPWDCCAFGSLFAPGATINPTTTTTGQSFNFLTGSVDGITYPGFTSATTFSLLSVGSTTLQFSGPSLQLPSSAAAGQRVELTVPFTMTGFLQLTPVTRFSSPPGTPVFAGDVTGSGTLHVLLDALSGPMPQWHASASYVFGTSAPAPTPEPASVLLVASGVAGVFARRWRRSTK